MLMMLQHFATKSEWVQGCSPFLLQQPRATKSIAFADIIRENAACLNIKLGNMLFRTIIFACKLDFILNCHDHQILA
jgi:hypothetical protein